MPNYKEFIFTEYKFNYSTGELSLNYSFDNKINFEEKVFWDVDAVDFAKIDKKLLQKAFANLHLIAGISYYKAYCPAVLKVESFELNEEQIVFWEKIYRLGLGEFFYKNQIDFRELISFENGLVSISKAKGGPESLKSQVPSFSKCLVPIGGGKDSLVTAELLKKAGFDFTLYSLGDSIPQKETAELVGKPRFTVKREISSNLFELNKQGVYNGHIPISAYIAFLSLVTSILYGYDYIVLSNEHSANYGNLDYLGMNVNHQYSKSLEFEQDFNNYVEKNITTGIKYFSLLRPFYELKIAKIFSQYPQYFFGFTSCNTNFKILKRESQKNVVQEGNKKNLRFKSEILNQHSELQTLNSKHQTKWCCKCPKCAFVYSILAPFISKEKMTEIFGKNLFEEEILENLFLELLGIQDNKPFECVGTAEETAVAFYLISQKEEWKKDFMIKKFEQEILPQIANVEELKAKVFGTYLENSLVPDEFTRIILRG